MKEIQYLIDEDGDPVIRQQWSNRLRYEVWCFPNNECVVECIIGSKNERFVSDYNTDSDFPKWMVVA